MHRQPWGAVALTPSLLIPSFPRRTKWIVENLGMVTLVGSQIWWTWETEDVFRRVREGSKHSMKDFAAKLTAQLSELTNMVRARTRQGGGEDLWVHVT